MKISFFDYVLKINLKRYPTPNSLGVLSLTYDEMHVPLLDLDMQHNEDNKKELIETIKSLQQKYMLGDFDIFETKGGYHCVCYNKVTYGEYIDIMSNTKGLDYGFKIQAVLRPEQATTLRFYTLNPEKYTKYLTTIRSASTRPLSNEHYQFFKHLKGEEPQSTKHELPVVFYYHHKTKHGKVKNGIKK